MGTGSTELGALALIGRVHRLELCHANVEMARLDIVFVDTVIHFSKKVLQ